MTPQQFIATWTDADLSERSAYQQHFLGLCELLGQPKPAEADKTGAWYTFEKGVSKDTGGQGFADVWMKGHFGWEYKGKRKDLKAGSRGRTGRGSPPGRLASFCGRTFASMPPLFALFSCYLTTTEREPASSVGRTVISTRWPKAFKNRKRRS
jgi:hypothetical protein